MSKAVPVEPSENPTPRLQVEQLKSWLPVDAVIDQGRPVIEWLDMTGVELTEPFFQQTVARTKQTKTAVLTDLDTLIQFEKVSDSLAPSGFIFHTSRCGSTLLANACRTLSGSLVVAEAPVLDKLISRFFTDTDDEGKKELLYSILLKCALSALGQRRFGNERHYFVKFAVASILQFNRIRQIWPTVPVVFLYRDPVETMVSNLQNVPEWMTLDSNPATSAAIAGVRKEDLANISSEEFCARSLGRFYKALATSQDENSFICNYNELSPEKLVRLINFFGVSVSEEEVDKIRASAQLHSKDPSQTFQADGDMKRANASERIKELAEQWAMPSYERLVNLTQGE